MSTATKAASVATANRILAALPEESLERLAPHLEPVSVALKEPIFEAREPVRHALLPLDCVLSFVTPIGPRDAVEIATVGNEGIAGLSAFLGTEWMPYRAFAQVPGQALRVGADVLAEQAAQDEELSAVLKRYTQALLTQVAQSTACNSVHGVEERCARWLLMTHDRVHGDHFLLTHEFLGMMLGVRRAGVTVAAGMLQRAGVIRYSRGKITVVDRAALEAASCECYSVVRAHFDRLLGGNTPAA
jgi:CRP-like cAMP-binding protein